METICWLFCNRTAETLLIFNLFHCLVAGLTLLVLGNQLRRKRGPIPTADVLLSAGFLLFVLDFAILTVYYGAAFFFRKGLALGGLELYSQGLLVVGLTVVVSAVRIRPEEKLAVSRWLQIGGAALLGIVLGHWLRTSAPVGRGDPGYWAASLLACTAVVTAAVAGIWAVLTRAPTVSAALVVAFASFGLAFVLHGVSLSLPAAPATVVWNSEEHMISVALFAFAWSAGERSRRLLDRIFVRLNLTFVVLASLIMLLTAGMEKYQYFRLAEERSMNLAEFLRGHIVYYYGRGEGLQGILRHPDVLKRVVVEFGTLPELRQVHVYLDGQRATFRYTEEWEVKEELVKLADLRSRDSGEEPANSFQMVRIPVTVGKNTGNRIEFFGTMDYINQYIGKNIIFIYSLFTVMVLLGTGIVGIIVAHADRQFNQQYAELRETQQQLAQAAKLASIGQLAGGMAHEINTPITSILSLASHMTDEKSAALLTPRQRTSLQVIAEQAQRVSEIVGDLLTFSRQSSLQLGRVDVNHLLDTALTLARYRAVDGRVHVSRVVEPSLPLIWGDAGRLTEVLVNVLNNAIDAMPSGGELTLRASANPAPEDGVCVEVTDTGCGIAPEHLPRIFDPFFTTKEPGRGTGLGLSISHGIVKEHSGEIWARSTPGQGTTVIMRFPRGDAR